MILSDTEIRKRRGNDSLQGDLVIRPYSDLCQQPASYDLRAADSVILTKGCCTLLSSLEWVELPKGVAGTLRCRSSLGRRGVLLGAGFVDPGFRGQVTLCLTNMGTADIEIQKNERVVQMIFHEVYGGNHLYCGQYQDSNGVVGAHRA
jgi:dCTP deaminase